MQIGYFLMTIKICPLCAEGHLSQSSYTCNVEYRGVKKDLTFSMHLCNICGGDMACNGDLNHNKTEVVSFRKEVDESLKKPLRGMSPHVLYFDDSSYIEDIKND